MSFNSALTAGQLTKLRSSTYYADYLITLCANRVVFAGQVNSDLSTANSWAEFDYNNVTTGAYTDVELNQVLLIGTTNDKSKATFRGRVRLAPTSTVIYCSESSQNFTIGDYFWVIDTYDIFYKLSRPDANGNELVDYDLTYAGCLPEVTGLRTAYVDYVDATSGKMRVAFSVSGYAVESGATISSYAWTFTAGTYTVVSGSLATATVTVDFDPGEQWGKLIVTDSGGRTLTRRFYINAHDASNPPTTGFDNATLSADLQRGWTMNIPAFTDVDSVLADTFAVCWRYNENYGGTAGNLDSTNNIAFVGWLQREEDNASADIQHSVVTESRFEFTGVGARLQRLVAQLLPFILEASPDAWGEIVNLTPWRGICHFLSRYTTVANLCDIDFSNKDNTYLFSALSTQGGTALQAIAGIAAQINANVEFAPDGRIRIDRDASFLSAAERAALTTVIAYDYQDAIGPTGIVKTLEENRQCGKVDADGAFYNSTNAQVTVYTARAPGHAQGEGSGSATLSSQILATTTNNTTALNELRQRVGNKYEIENMSEALNVEHPDGYHFLIPSRAQLYTWTLTSTLPGANGINRIVYDTGTFWLCEGVTIARTGNGSTSIKATYRRLTRVGDLGDDTTVIVVDTIIPAAEDIGSQAFPDEYPETVVPENGWLPAEIPPTYATPPGVAITLKGQEVVAKTDTQAFLLTQFINRTTPYSKEITPSDLGSYEIKQILVDPFASTTTTLGVYILASDGTDSAVWYCDNALDSSPTWTKGTSYTGVYTVIRTTNVAGNILIYAPDTAGGSSTQIFDFTASDGGWSPAYDGGARATYIAGTGWSTVDNTDSLGEKRRIVDIQKSFGSLTLTALSYTYNYTKGTFTNTASIARLLATNIGLLQSSPASATSNGTGLTYAWTGSQAGVTTIEMLTVSSKDEVAPIVFDGSALMTAASVTGTSSAGAVVRHSADYGSTFTFPIDIGTTPGSVGGFDTQLAGTVSYAGYTGSVVKATTLGGAYSAFISTTGANPVCIIVPWYTQNSTSVKNTTGSTPDCIVALDAVDSDGGTLYWVAGGTGVKTDITPTTGMTFDNANCVTTSYGTHIAVVGKVGGTYYLYTSTNGGTSWTSRGAITAPHFIRGRRKDNRVVTYGGGDHGQLYVIDGNAIDYSYTWKNGSPRTMPVADIEGFDVVG